MFGKLISNIVMCFMKPRVDDAANQLRNDSDIKDAFEQLEIALQDLKETTEKKNAYFDSEENRAHEKRIIARIGKRALDF